MLFLCSYATIHFPALKKKERKELISNRPSNLNYNTAFQTQTSDRGRIHQSTNIVQKNTIFKNNNQTPGWILYLNQEETFISLDSQLHFVILSATEMLNQQKG